MAKVSTLPSYKKPPIIELALGVQFDNLSKVKTSHLGAWWATIKDKFPKVEEHPPLPEITESYEIDPQKTVQFRFAGIVPPIRCWFLNESGNELVQVQSNRFVYNWRKQKDEDAYPRFQKISSLFSEMFNNFTSYIEKFELGKIVPNQCEVTYVNHIQPGVGWEKHNQIGNVFPSYTDQRSDDFLNAPESVGVNLGYVFRDAATKPLGRLHVSISSEYRIADKLPILVMNLVSRGAPFSPDMKGVLGFLEQGHDWNVRGFTSLTTKQMHKIWERE
jgi:uncharacterized protein (TIGR04255 family)